MKKYQIRIILFLLVTFYSADIVSQEEKEVNLPIIFAEFMFGGAGRINGNAGILVGGELNYQYKKNLFSIRYLENSQLESNIVFLSPVTPFPILREKNYNKETGLLYGKRWIYGGSSLSFSGGISFNSYSSKFIDENDDHYRLSDNYVGFPFEMNFKWFKSEKNRYRIMYGAIPVGKPTAFGRDFGFKLTGNISRNSLIGVGLVYGMGIHKNY
ncbi:hypothetical protein RM553_18670 [Zunongwangia sp. F363]|uniref:Outer membrane protein beta-barrel domain-containing protein n=1 Tax=Autumnicola tepida TaxID=3075595 RepID=A0ABU3CEU8_9FLAO|nr:hypothetical protein [Zunongwangia sp. F363]MDT0644868.1 hypothetical protein [Zunongwangia sp. F363]